MKISYAKFTRPHYSFIIRKEIARNSGLIKFIAFLIIAIYFIWRLL
jgi:hypothetical protein